MAVDRDPLSNDLLRRALERAGQVPETLDLRPAEVKANFDPDLVPDISSDEQRSDEDLAIDGVLDRLDILDAYDRWIGKKVKERGGGKNHVMISCPHPQHPDNDPSASINLADQVWYCHACGIGGDKYDLAAIKFGYGWPDQYKNDGTFPNLRRDMAIDLGYTVVRIGSQEYLEPPAPVEHSDEQMQGTTNDLHIQPVEVRTPLASVTPLEPDLSDFEGDFQDLAQARIDWELIVPKGTFLYEWMKAATIGDIPHEFFFWLGMQAVGQAAGHDVWLVDSMPVKANCFVCLFGNSASGKTRAIHPFEKMIKLALPWDGDDQTPSKGTKILPTPASAEALIDMFTHQIKDPSTQQVVDHASVRGLLKIDEFSSFVSRSTRPGTTMKETFIELYDASWGAEVSNHSRTHGLMKAVSPFAQVVTTTQPKAIHAYLRRSDAESGFLNRWVFAAGARRVARISYGAAPVDVTKPAEMLKDLWRWCSTGREMKLEGPALAVWDNFFQDEIVPLQDTDDDSMLSRTDLILKKLIILFTINSKEAQPTAQTVGQAISLFPYLILTGRMFSKNLGHSDQEDCRQRIQAYLAQKPTGASPKQIIRSLGGKYEAQLINSVFKLMIDLQEITVKTDTAKGPKTSRYVLSA